MAIVNGYPPPIDVSPLAAVLHSAAQERSARMEAGVRAQAIAAQAAEAADRTRLGYAALDAHSDEATAHNQTQANLEGSRQEGAMNLQQQHYALQAQLSQTQLSQAEQQHAQQLDRQINYLQQQGPDGTGQYSAQEVADWTTQLRTHLNPYQQRAQRAAAVGHELQNNLLMQQTGLQASGQHASLQAVGAGVFDPETRTFRVNGVDHMFDGHRLVPVGNPREEHEMTRQLQRDQLESKQEESYWQHHGDTSGRFLKDIETQLEHEADPLKGGLNWPLRNPAEPAHPTNNPRVAPRYLANPDAIATERDRRLVSRMAAWRAANPSPSERRSQAQPNPAGSNMQMGPGGVRPNGQRMEMPQDGATPAVQQVQGEEVIAPELRREPTIYGPDRVRALSNIFNGHIETGTTNLGGGQRVTNYTVHGAGNSVEADLVRQMGSIISSARAEGRPLNAGEVVDYNALHRRLTDMNAPLARRTSLNATPDQEAFSMQTRGDVTPRQRIQDIRDEANRLYGTDRRYTGLGAPGIESQAGTRNNALLQIHRLLNDVVASGDDRMSPRQVAKYMAFHRTLEQNGGQEWANQLRLHR